MPEPLQLVSMNHFGRQTRDIEKAKQFYRDVLGFRDIERPPFPSPGAWLYNCGVQLHLIDVDAYSSEPAPRDPINLRENHLAFAVADIECMEQRLKEHGIEYVQALIPERGTPQLFFRDPDGWMIEVGRYDFPIDR